MIGHVHSRRMRGFWVAAWLSSVLLCACNRSAIPSAPTSLPSASPSDHLLGGRQALLEALRAQSVFEPPRMVAHVAHVCTLDVAGQPLLVVDLQELVKGATTPRGVNAVLILDRELHLKRRIDYTTERPLFCRGNRLYVWGDLSVDGIAGEGNELSFASDASITGIAHVEANDLPAPTAGRDPIHP